MLRCASISWMLINYLSALKEREVVLLLSLLLLEFAGIKVFEFLFIKNVVDRPHISFHIKNIGFCIIRGTYDPNLFFKLVNKFVYDIFRVCEVPKSS